MPSQLGRRYQCGVCATVILCTKAGDGAMACCGQEVALQQTKKLPSSD